MNKRIEWADIVKYICIMFVIMAHSETNTELLHSFYTPFILNGFLFVSGYCYKNGNDFSLLLRKKTEQLFIPWLIWGLIKVCSQGIYSVFGTVSHELSFGERIKRLLLQIRGLDDPVWFVAMMFISFIPFFFLIRSYEASRNKKKYKWLLLVLHIIGLIYSAYMPSFSYGTNALPWHIEYLPVSLFVMFLGYEYRNCYEQILKEKEDGLFPVFTVLFLVTVCVSYFCSFPAPVDIFFQTIERLVGIAEIVLVSKRIKANRYILFVGQNTLIYFPMHIYVDKIADVFLRKVIPNAYTVILNHEFLSTGITILTAFAVSVLLIVPAKFISRYLPFMAGKGKLLQRV